MQLRSSLNLITALLCLVVRVAAADPGRPVDPPPPGPETRAASTPSLEQRIADLEREIAELKRRLAETRAPGGGSTEESLKEIERRLDLLAEEIQRLRAGAAASESAAAAAPGLGPAASKVYARDRGVSIGGYGEALYQNFASRNDDGSPAAAGDTLDLERAVFYFGYKFENRIVFNSEIEYEHATTGEGGEEKGEVSVEFAYLEFPLTHRIAIRAGKILVPIGLVNELHEPPVFLGARRPDVETLVVPTTWSEIGAGLFGEAGPVSWRGVIVAGLDASGFTAEGIREGRQDGSQSKARDLALAARVDWTLVPGLVLGASVFTGDAGQGLRDVSGRTIAARTNLVEGHADWKYRRWQARALWARGRVSDVARLDEALGLTGAASIGSASHGAYAEVGYDLLGAAEGNSSLVPYARLERYGTQDRVPSGYERDLSMTVRASTIGIAWKPIANVVLKADHQDYRNRAGTGLDRWNLALGYLF